MREHTSKALRELLRFNDEGLSVTDMAERLRMTPDGVRKSLKHMPDTYIASWVPASTGRMMSIWRVVVPPADAVNPEVLSMPHITAKAPRQPAPPKAAPAPRNHKPQGITQIRGPWPTHA